jgi:hypothetical protein
MKKITVMFLAFLVSTYCNSQTILWQNTIGGISFDELTTSAMTADSGYIIGGYSLSNISGDKSENCIGLHDYWVVKLSSNDTIQWQNTIGGDNHDFLQSIQQTTDGGYILGGESFSDASGDKTESSNGLYDYWVIKLDYAGNIQWQNSIGGNDYDELQSISQTFDGGFILAGTSASNISGDKTEINYGSDYWIIKLDAFGGIQWQNTIMAFQDDYATSIQQTTDGGYIVGGHSNSNISVDKTENSKGGLDFWFLKLNAQGVIQWQKTLGGSGDDYVTTIRQTSDGGYIIGGTSNSNISGDKIENSKGSFDYWILKVDTSGGIEWQNTIGGINNDYLNSLLSTSDGGYFLGGHSESNISGDKTENSKGGFDYWLVKIDSLGNIQWQKTIGGSNDDVLNSIQQTIDGNSILAGISSSGISGDKTENSQGQSDYWVVKMGTLTQVSELYTVNKMNITVNPNPTNGNFNATFFSSQSEATKITILNVFGQNVYENKIFSSIGINSITIVKNELTSGIYLISVETGDQLLTTKFYVNN